MCIYTYIYVSIYQGLFEGVLLHIIGFHGEKSCKVVFWQNSATSSALLVCTSLRAVRVQYIYIYMDMHTYIYIIYIYIYIYM